MKVDKFSQHIYDVSEVFDILMENGNVTGPFLVPDSNVKKTNKAAGFLLLDTYKNIDMSVAAFDDENHRQWEMPDYYKKMDICAYILEQCDNQNELQRGAQELLIFQDMGMFDLLRYMHYLVDTMILNNVIWGVGRGSSVSSFVLYKLKVHRVDSLFYQLDCTEFLRGK